MVLTVVYCIFCLLVTDSYQKDFHYSLSLPSNAFKANFLCLKMFPSFFRKQDFLFNASLRCILSKFFNTMS